MTDINFPVTEDELHAYVDGELPPDRQNAVAAWLASHPEDAALIAAWRTQADAIRTRYGAVASEPVPERLKLNAVLRQGRSSRRSWAAYAAAAAIAAFMVGGVVGWQARGASSAPSSFDVFTAEALDAYNLYVVEVRHPVEVPGDERAHMTQWLSKRLGYEQRIPDLQSIGLKLVGGRLLPGPTGPTAFFMYESTSGERFTLYCGRTSDQPTALLYTAGERNAAYYWVDGNVAYVLSGPAQQDRLHEIAKSAYDQIDQRTPL
jgi:anti-sigma factor RsiW